MYEKFFYLTENPFNITPDPRYLYLSSKHAEAIDLLLYGIKNKKGFIMLTGEVGTGKTTLCRAIMERLPVRTESALILNPMLSGTDLLRTITDDFGLRVEGESVKAHLDSLNGFLIKAAGSGCTAVVIIDEAQNLSAPTLEMIRMLTNLETEKEKLLQIVLIGQPELRTKLAAPGLRQLNQRITVRYDLTPLDYEETEAYIHNRLFIAGGGATVRFESDATRAVFGASLGIPRVINIVCDRVLTSAYIEESRKVDARIVERALEELRSEGFFATGRETSAEPAYRRFLPHIAVSAFAASFTLGIFLAPVIEKMTSLAGSGK